MSPHTEPLLHYVRRLVCRPNADSAPDATLLDRFVSHRDETAFAALLARHGPMVWGVCRRILGHQQDAEDAFQATFVILARRAASSRWRPSVGGWLHTVAQRLAVRTRQQVEQWRIQERDASRALRLWEVLTASELLALPTIECNAKVAFSSDGRVLAATAPSGEISLWDLRKGKEARRFKGFGALVTSLTFSPDGRRLASGLSNSTLLVWDVGTLPAALVDKLGAKEAAKAWADLASNDAPRAFRARRILASAPAQALPLLSKHLHPARPANPQRLRQLLADLESEQFAVREKAQEALAELGDLAEPTLRQTLANKPTLEVRRRVQALLERLRGPVTRPQILQALRAVAVLENIGTLAARRVLQELAKGAPEARLSREAKAALQRLDLRKPSGQ